MEEESLQDSLCTFHVACLAPAGYEVDGIHEAPDPVDAVRKAEGIFIGEEKQDYTNNRTQVSC